MGFHGLDNFSSNIIIYGLKTAESPATEGQRMIRYLNLNMYTKYHGSIPIILIHWAYTQQVLSQYLGVHQNQNPKLSWV